MEKEKKMKKEAKLGLVILILSMIICIGSVSYAIWKYSANGKKENRISTATLILDIEDEQDEISLVSQMPVSDATGLSYKPYKFNIKNKGTTTANYRISIIDEEKAYQSDGCSNKKLSWSDIKFHFQRNNTTPIMEMLDTNKGILYSGKLAPNEVDSFKLRMWIKSSAGEEIMDKHFHGRIYLEAIQEDRDLTS